MRAHRCGETFPRSTAIILGLSVLAWSNLAVAQGLEYVKAHYTKYEYRIPMRDGWHPHQLRHNTATRLRRKFGLDTARAVLGHSSLVITEVYAELDQAKASEAMGKIG